MIFIKAMKSLVLLFALDFSLVQSGSDSESSHLFIGKYRIPSETKGPLNIETSKVKKANDLSPIHFTAPIFESTKVKNTGKAVEVFNTEVNSATTVTGGPLLKDVYKFYVTIFRLSGNSSGPAATTVDDVNGVPIEALALWYNLKYDSFENSKHYRDGMAAISFPVTVGPLPSLTFLPFARKLEKIRESNSSVSAFLFEHFIWFDGYLLPPTPYYAYPGSYTDPETSKKYYCTTNIIFQPHINTISNEQFEKYIQSLKNSKGDRLTNPLQSQPQGDIPVIEAVGQIQVFIPFGKRLTDLSLL
ncbi:carbonic anhydrase 3-like [Planococcus citri]|uniref:carbonic anhydrase 3-like n=1 Tax=Planococcus citri TaxID=170843 RepID=UPI0031FA2A1F